MECVKKNEKHIFEDFYLYKAKKSGNFLCAKIWGNFQAPHKQRFGFCDSSFLLRFDDIYDTSATFV